MSLREPVEILTGGRLPDLGEMPFAAVRKRMSEPCRELLDSLETRVALASRPGCSA